MRKFLMGITLMFISLDIHAQFKVDARLRNRLEFRDGYQKLAAEGSIPGIFISQQSRITFKYETDNLKLVFAPQDVRIWGGDQTVNSTGVAKSTTMGLFEGYAEVKLGGFGWVAAGRQQLKYDDEFI